MAVSFRDQQYGLLNGWQARAGVSIWQFNQITGTGADAPVSEPGEDVYIQPEREVIAESLTRAREMVWEACNFPHRPVFISETLTFSSMSDLRRYGTPLRWKHVQAIGKRTTTLISAGATVTYSDTDGDGINDTATITAATSVTDASEVKVYFTASDSRAVAADARWEIEPLTVTISGGTATITGHRALFANPTLWRNPTRSPNYQQASKNAGDTTDTNDFVTTVDVYRVYATTTDAVTLTFNPYRPAELTDTFTPVTEAAQGALIDGRLGLVLIAPSVNAARYTYPVSVTIHYVAGYPLDTWSKLNDRALETAIIRLANSMLPAAVPSTAYQRKTWEMDDQAMTEVFLARARFNNPFGTAKGAVAAWDTVKDYQILPSPREV